MRFLLLLALSGLCLAAHPPIIGGTSVLPTELSYRSTVAVMREMDGEFEVFCTGTVAGRQLVITAAHCLVEHYLGDIYVAFGEDPVKAPKYKIEKMKYYTKDLFNDLLSNQDVAILISAAPLDGVPVAIALPTELNSKSSFIQVGYGHTSLASEAGDVEDLYPNYGRLQMLTTTLFKALLGATVSVLEPASQRTSMGDSGGPLFLKKDGALLLSGVLSNGEEYVDEKGNVFENDMYAHPYYFVNWMNCSLPDEQKIKMTKLKNQKKCDKVPTMGIDELIAFNKAICKEVRAGWAFSEDYGRCWPQTLSSCQELAEVTEDESIVWVSETKSCEYME